MHGALPFVGVVAAAVVVVAGGLAYRRYRRRSPSSRAGYEPKSLSPWMRLWRQRRADKGKGDNWLTRPLIRFDGRDGSIEVLPKDEPPHSHE